MQLSSLSKLRIFQKDSVWVTEVQKCKESYKKKQLAFLFTQNTLCISYLLDVCTIVYY